MAKVTNGYTDATTVHMTSGNRYTFEAKGSIEVTNEQDLNQFKDMEGFVVEEVVPAS